MRSPAVLAVFFALACSSDPLVSTPASDAPSAPTGAPTSLPTGAPTGSAPSPNADGADFAPKVSYPPGPYGRGVGAVIENTTFLGWRDPVASNYDTAALEPVSLSDFYDPSATTTKLIVINASAVWCTVCQAELKQMKNDNTAEKYRAQGVQLLGTLFEDATGGPARPSDLRLWGSAAVRAIDFPLVLDPGLKMGVYFTSDATPLNLIVDARDMRIVYAMMGYDNSPTTGLWSIVDRELAKRAE
jgi:hypothetical protein